MMMKPRRRTAVSLVLLTIVLPLVCIILLLFYQTPILLPARKPTAPYQESSRHDDNNARHHHNTSIETSVTDNTPAIKEVTTRIPPSSSSQRDVLQEIINPTKANYSSTNDKKDRNGDETANHTLSSLFFVNNIMTTREPRMFNSSCHRPCFDFRNRIYFSPAPNEAGAGLMDRLTIFGTLLNMAGYLCARVYAPRPRHLLWARHNANHNLDVNMSWSEFGEFVFWNDPLQRQHPALIDWDNPLDLQERPISKSLYNTTTAELFHYSELPKQVKYDFKKIETFTSRQQKRLTTRNEPSSSGGGFVWVIAADYFQWCNLLSHHLQSRPPPKRYLHEVKRRWAPFIFASRELCHGCQYAKVGLSANLQYLQQRIVSEIFLQPPESLKSSISTALATTKSTTAALPPLIGYLHIRRQDTVRICDTSLRRMAAYLNCSLGDVIRRISGVPLDELAPSTARRTILILFSSDEDDPQYRSQILQLIEELPQQSHVSNDTVHVIGMDLDALVERIIRLEVLSGNTPAWRLNNFQIFQLILSIGYNQTIAKFQLEQRREEACSACTNVVNQLIKLGTFDNFAIPTEQTRL